MFAHVLRCLLLSIDIHPSHLLLHSLTAISLSKPLTCLLQKGYPFYSTLLQAQDYRSLNTGMTLFHFRLQSGAEIDSPGSPFVPDMPADPAFPFCPLSPGSPLGPAGAMIPCFPFFPGDPIIPLSPLVPRFPFFPFRPRSPFSPLGPGGPGGPGRPEKHVSRVVAKLS